MERSLRLLSLLLSAVLIANEAFAAKDVVPLEPVSEMWSSRQEFRPCTRRSFSAPTGPPMPSPCSVTATRRSCRSVNQSRCRRFSVFEIGHTYWIETATSSLSTRHRQRYARVNARRFSAALLHRTPYAIITGGLIIGISELTSLFQSSAFESGSSFLTELLAGMGIFYLIDGTWTMYVRSHGQLGGTNLFTYPIATGIQTIEWRTAGDFALIPKRPILGAPDLHISDVAPSFTQMSECYFALTAATKK